MIKNTIKFLIKKKDSGQRLDVYLSNKINDFTRSYLKKVIESRLVKINSRVINSPSYKIKINDAISIFAKKREIENLTPSNISLNIIFEDEDVLVVNKPKGMVVHPGAGNYDDTLANALIYKYHKKLSNINGATRPGIVHRIDKDTSGLLVVAKNNYSHAHLGKQFNEHSIERNYLCLVWGVLRPLKGRIETLITRNKRNRQLMMVSEKNGKKAITNYNTLKIFNIKNIPKISLIECNLETGRTHQIRVHMMYKGTSLLGDEKYGKKNLKFKRIEKEFLTKLNSLKGQALHAKSLGFNHPKKNKWLKFQVDPADDIKKLLNYLKKRSS